MSRPARGTEGTTRTAAAQTKAGFTLLELSIVLTIIGLIIGGVLTGQSLIQQAKLNKLMTDIQKFVTAVQTFQNKYNALPGDMNNATKYWGAAGMPTNAAACYNTVGTGTQTCDGDGNGQISGTESYRTWQHLQLAGLIEGSYTGVIGSTNLSIPGTNAPKGPIGNSGYDMFWYGDNTGVASPFAALGPINFGHIIIFGSSPGGDRLWSPTLTTSEILSIDSKYDDGKPFSGIISVGHVAYDPNCATSPFTAASTYNLTYQGLACSIDYVTGF